MAVTAIRTKPKYVRLGGMDLLPRGPVQFELTNMHGRKVSVGDPGPDSHPTNSTITQHSWSGGGQIKIANENSDMMRFWWSTLATEYDHYLTLPPETHVYGEIGDFSMCLGDFPYSDGGDMLFQIGTNLVRYVPPVTEGDPGSTAVLAPMGSFTAQGEGVVYAPTAGPDNNTVRLFIPGGADGLGMWDGTTFTAIVTDNVVDLAVWDEKLFLLDRTGHLWWSIHPSGVFPTDWTNVVGSGQSVGIPDGSSPRHLVNYVNRSDAEVLYVITSSAVWGLDFANGRLVKTYFSYPRHPRQGLGATHWRAELWTSVGMGAHRYDLSQVIPSGIDRDQGTPLEFRGYVTDIVGSYNDLFMYIRGVQVPDTTTTNAETETLDVGGGDETMYADSTQFATRNLLVNWNGLGYHYRWDGPGANPGNMLVSQANGQYNLWWCNQGQVLRQRIPITYFNPVDPPTAGFTWAESGFLETPWYDWNWADQVKTLKRLEFGVDSASPEEMITVWYQVDLESPVWTKCLEINAPGRWSCTMGEDPGDDSILPGTGTRRYYGIPHNRFRLRLEMKRGADKTQRPTLDWWSAVGRRVLNPIRTWRFNLDLTKQSMGDYPGTTAAFLQHLAMTPTATQFDLWDESFMVEVVALSGPKDMTSQEFSGFVTVHLLEANDIEITLP